MVFFPAPSARRRAFSIIEMVIVLALVGLMLGAIWATAASLRASRQATEMAEVILTSVSRIQRLFPYDTYSLTNGTSNSITSTVFNAGLVPKSFVISGGYIRSPTGVAFGFAQSCYSTCPMLGVALQGPASAARSTLTAEVCTQLLRKYAIRLSNRTDFIYAQIAVPGNSSYRFLFPPISPSLAICPANTEYVNFWFKP